MSEAQDENDLELGRTLREYGVLMAWIASGVLLMTSRDPRVGLKSLPLNDKELTHRYKKRFDELVEAASEQRSLLTGLLDRVRETINKRNNIIHPYWNAVEEPATALRIKFDADTGLWDVEEPTTPDKLRVLRERITIQRTEIQRFHRIILRWYNAGDERSGGTAD